MSFSQVQAGQLAEHAVHFRHLADDVPLGAATPPLFQSFDFTTAHLPLLIGTIAADRRIHTVVCQMLTACNTGVRLTVGDANAHGRLFASADILPQVVMTYEGHPEIVYQDATNLYLYVEAGTPTHGAGVITVYFQ